MGTGAGASSSFVTFGFIVVIMGLVIWRRTRAMSRPIRGNGVRILIPLIFILPGVMMFLNPKAESMLNGTSTLELLIALLVGIVMSIPLIMTTNYEIRQDGEIYAKKSKAFVFALVVLVVLRLVLRSYVANLDPTAFTWLIYVLALGYVIPWRVVSFLKFRKVMQMKNDRVTNGTAGSL